jgi:hypothetical protein
LAEGKKAVPINLLNEWKQSEHTKNKRKVAAGKNGRGEKGRTIQPSKATIRQYE